MTENKKDERLDATTRIVTDHGIDNLQPANEIHQEIFNEILPPGGYDESRPVEYTYHRVNPGSSGSKKPYQSKSRSSRQRKGPPIEDIEGCQCEEQLRNYCHGTDWCDTCCKSKSNVKGSSSRKREGIKIPDFNKMGLFGNSGRRSSNGGGSVPSNQSNVNNRTSESTRRGSNNISGGASNQSNNMTSRASSSRDPRGSQSHRGSEDPRGSQSHRGSEDPRGSQSHRGKVPLLDPNESPIGSKHYTGGERGERNSRENCDSHQRQRRRSSRVDDKDEDDICQDIQISKRTQTASDSNRIARDDSMNRNKWHYTAQPQSQRQRCCPPITGNNFTVVDGAHESTELSCDEGSDQEELYNGGHNHCTLQTCCPPTHRLSIELSPVTSTSTCDPRRRSRDIPRNVNRNNSNKAIARRSSDPNANCKSPQRLNSAQNNNNNKICFDLTLECPNDCVTQNAGDAVRRNSSKALQGDLVVPRLSSNKVFEGYPHRSTDSPNSEATSSSVWSLQNGQNGSIILAILFLWLFVLSIAFVNQYRATRYAGIYP